MSVHEEVQEHAHHAEQPFDKKVAASMAIIAAVLAVVSVLGHILTTEAILEQQKASDQWAYSQAKDIRAYSARVARDLLSGSKTGGDVLGTYEADAKRYKDETRSIQDKAREFERERDRKVKQADRMHFGEVFLELAIVLSSLAILTKKNLVWAAGVASALVGSAVAATALLL